jgi:hypothetical protein
MMEDIGRVVERLGRFVRDGTLYVMVHPAWEVYFGSPPTGNNPMQEYSDSLLTKAVSYNREALADEKKRYSDGSINRYLGSLRNFFTAYEFLMERSHLELLKRKFLPTLIVRPGKDYNAAMGRFDEFLTEATGSGQNFAFIDSIAYNMGQIHNEGEITPAGIVDSSKSKLRYLKLIAGGLGSSRAILSGGYVNGCMIGAERSINLAGQENTIVLLDASVMDPTIKNKAFNLIGGKVGIKPEIEQQYKRILGQMVIKPVDFTSLAEVIGKPYHEQLAAMQRFNEVVFNLMELKRILSFSHPRTSFAADAMGLE